MFYIECIKKNQMFTYMKLHVMKAVHINDSSNSVFLVNSGIVNMWKSSLLGISLAFYLISMSLSKSVERKLMNISKVYCASFHYILISCAYFVKPLHAGLCVYARSTLFLAYITICLAPSCDAGIVCPKMFLPHI